MLLFGLGSLCTIYCGLFECYLIGKQQGLTELEYQGDMPDGWEPWTSALSLISALRQLEWGCLLFHSLCILHEARDMERKRALSNSFMEQGNRCMFNITIQPATTILQP